MQVLDTDLQHVLQAACSEYLHLLHGAVCSVQPEEASSGGGPSHTLMGIRSAE